MRIKSHWFKGNKEKTPEEIAGAMAFTIWRIADNALKSTRKADFEISIGAQYFHFMTEFLAFLIQVADRIAYRDLSSEDRIAFTNTLANRVAETLAENQSRLMDGTFAEHKQQFIDNLNKRADEYAEFHYGDEGPEFAFTRYLGFCMRDVMDDKDVEWIVDQTMSIEAPNAVDMVEKTMKNLLGKEPRQARSSKVASGD